MEKDVTFFFKKQTQEDIKHGNGKSAWVKVQITWGIRFCLEIFWGDVLLFENNLFELLLH